MDSNDFFSPRKGRVLGEFRLSEPQGAMTDEQKLIAAGFKPLKNYQNWVRLSDSDGWDEWAIDVRIFPHFEAQIVFVQTVNGFTEDNKRDLPHIKTVDDILTLARLLGLSKEVE